MDDAPRQRTDDDFDALYRGHVTDVYRYSLSLVRDPADAEDVTQTTFLNAYEAFTENPPRKPRPWLIAIARNVCHERYRQALRRPQQVALHEVSTTPEENYGVRADEIISALQGIPGRQRVALLLDGLEGRSRAEIAQKLEIGEATVSGLLTRGRNNLRLQLDQGMTCERAQWASPRLWANGLPRAERRAAIAHLRNCESCSLAGVPPRSLSGLIGLFWLGTRKVTDPITRYFPTGSGAAGASGALATKIVLLAAVGTLAGGVAWHEAGRFTSSSPNASTTGAGASVAPLTDAATRADIGLITLVPAAATMPAATLSSVATAAAAVGHSPAVRAGASHASAPAGASAVAASGSATGTQTGDGTSGRLLTTAPQSEHEPGPATTGEESAPESAPGAGDDSAGSTETTSGDSASGQGTGGESATRQGGSQSAPSGQIGKPVTSGPGRATAPGLVEKHTGPASAPGKVKKPGTSAKAIAPGQLAQADGSTPGQATAPGQVKKPGTSAKAIAPDQLAQADGSTPGQATAPGQVKDADAAAKAAAPGLIKKTDGSTTGQASAPAQHTAPTAPAGSGAAQGQGTTGQGTTGQGTTGQGTTGQGTTGQGTTGQGTTGQGTTGQGTTGQGTTGQGTTGQGTTGQGTTGQGTTGQGTTGQGNAAQPDPPQGGEQGQPADPGGGSGNANAGGQGGGGGAHDPKP